MVRSTTNAMTASEVGVRPFNPVVGAEITGVDLHQPVADDAFARIHQALLDHGMLVFPGQHLDAEALDRFGRRWGEPLVVPYLKPHQVPGLPAVLEVTNMGKAETLTENWHFDSAFFDEPPPIAILAAQQLPEVGGDTMWASQYAAYDALSDTMKGLLDGLRGIFAGTKVGDDGERFDVETPHPLVRVHPITGRKALAAGRPGESVPRIEGMTAEESRPILQFLYDHASRPDWVYRHRWSQGDVVMWDNRCLLHYAVHDYGDEVRNLIRITILGEPCR